MEWLIFIKSALINIGLGFDIIGALFLFWITYKPNILETLNRDKFTKKGRTMRRTIQECKIIIFSILLGIGFLLQFIANQI